MDGLTWISFHSIIQLKKYKNTNTLFLILTLFVLEVICSYYTWSYAIRNLTFASNSWFYLEIIVTIGMQFMRDFVEHDESSWKALHQAKRLMCGVGLLSLYLSVLILAYVVILHENVTPLNAELIGVLVIYPFLLCAHFIEIKGICLL